MTGKPVVNIFTVDVEDWYQSSVDRNAAISGRVSKNTERLLALLSALGVKGTFYVLGRAAEKFPEIVRQIESRGHEIGSHGYSHKPVFLMNAAEFREDLRLSVSILQGITGREIRHYRAPDFSIVRDSLWALDILRDEGFMSDSSIFPVRSTRYGIPSWDRFPHKTHSGLLELPVSTVRLFGANIPFSGGGYLRLLPYCFIRRALQHVNSLERKPVITYVHPYELDECETGELSAGAAFRERLYMRAQGAGRSTVRRKLTSLLSEFRYTSVSGWIDGENAHAGPGNGKADL